MPSLMAVSWLRLPGPEFVPVGCCCWDRREWASIGGAGSEAYADMIVVDITRFWSIHSQFMPFIAKFCCQAMVGIQYK